MTEMLKIKAAIYLIFLACSMLVSAPHAAELSASVDRNPITIQEDVTLILTLDGQSKIDGETPDLQPLQRDFQVLGQTQSSRINTIKGHTTAQLQWQISLFPKREGTLTIPSLEVGGLHSQPLQLRVLPVQQSQDKDAEIFMEAEVEPKQVYVQQQAVYTLRLLTRVPLRAEAFPDPKVEGATVQALGEDQITQVLRDGRRYTQVEKRYAIFPEHSGSLEIPPVLFSGSLNAEKMRRSPFDDFNFPFENMLQPNRGKRVRIPSPSMSLQVAPQPSEFRGGDWLPASSLVLTETWQPEDNQFRAGQPITRSMSLQAGGVRAEQLPKIPQSIVDGISAYPDQPQLKTETVASGMIAERTEKVLLRAPQAGTFTLPEIRIPWWDTREDKLRYAVLPARTIHIQGGQGSTQPAALGTESQEKQPNTQTAPESQTALSPMITDSTITIVAAHDFWPWISAALGVGWVITLFAWARQRSHPRSISNDKPVMPPGLAAAHQALRKACLANDPHAAYQAWQQWQRARWPASAKPDNPLPEEAQAALHELDAVLYAAASPAKWDGTACWQRLEPALRHSQHQRQTSPSPLPRLYPQTLAS